VTKRDGLAKVNAVLKRAKLRELAIPTAAELERPEAPGTDLE